MLNLGQFTCFASTSLCSGGNRHRHWPIIKMETGHPKNEKNSYEERSGTIWQTRAQNCFRYFVLFYFVSFLSPGSTFNLVPKALPRWNYETDIQPFVAVVWTHPQLRPHRWRNLVEFISTLFSVKNKYDVFYFWRMVFEVIGFVMHIYISYNSCHRHRNRIKYNSFWIDNRYENDKIYILIAVSWFSDDIASKTTSSIYILFSRHFILRFRRHSSIPILLDIDAPVYDFRSDRCAALHESRGEYGNE